MKKYCSLPWCIGLFFLSLVTFQSRVVAQTGVRQRTWDVGCAAGTTISYTDISANEFGRDQSWAAGFTASKYFSRWFALRGELLTGGISGEGSKSGVNTKYSFKSNINAELSVQSVFQYPGLLCSNGVARFAPYVFFGVGLINVNPRVYQKGVDGSANYFIDKINGTKDNTVDYRNLTHLVIPAGAGVKFRLGDKYSIGVEAACRVSNTDKLNGYNENPSGFDAYAFYSVRFSIQLGKEGDVLQWKGCSRSGGTEHSFKKVSIYHKKKRKKPATSPIAETATGEQVVPEVPVKEVATSTPQAESVGATSAGVQMKGDADSVKATAMTVRLDSILPSVYFEHGSYLVGENEYPALDAIAAVMAINSTLKVKLTGIINLDIDSQVERSLALIRAEAVKNRLVRMYGIDASRIVTMTVTQKPEKAGANGALSRVDITLVK